MPIGPGRLVLVVGPSGAGKDTLIDGARAVLRDDPGVVFPRRVVTRPASPGEDHDSLSVADFARRAAEGAFALCWKAHGLSYGVPGSIDADLRAGRTVVCNVSRAVVAAARARYQQVLVALVTAPEEVLASRLAARARASDGVLADRLARPANALAADVVIQNVEAPEAGIALLISVIHAGHVTARRPPP